MSESRLVPRNLMKWPSVRNMVPDQRLILYHLWVTCESAAGVDMFDPGSISGCLGLREGVIIDSWQHMQDRGLLIIDDITGELMLNNWFRFHRFEGIRMKLLIQAVDRIESESFRKAVSIKINDLKNKQSQAKSREGNNKPSKPVDESALREIAAAILQEELRKGFSINNRQAYIERILVRLQRTGPLPADWEALKKHGGIDDPLAA